MPNLNKNLAAVPVYNVDVNGNQVNFGGAPDGSAPTGTPTLVAGTDGTLTRTLRTDPNGRLHNILYGVNGNSVGVTGPNDGVSNATTALTVLPLNLTFNGTTWDRQRDVTSANNTVGTGVTAVGPLAAYNSVSPTFVDGRMGELQITAQGRLLIQQSSTATLSGDGQSSGFTGNGVTAVASQGQVFNGSSWDRMRGDTSGVWIGALSAQTETQTVLAAGGTYTGATRSPGTASRFCYFIADAWADQAGTLYVERSVDGTTWRPANGTSGTAVAAGASVQVKVPTTTGNYRVRYVNGGTAQTAFLLTNALSLN